MTMVLGILALFISLVALWLAADIQQSTTVKNALMIKGQITPLEKSLNSDRAENETLRKQVHKDRDIIVALNEEVKGLEVRECCG